MAWFRRKRRIDLGSFVPPEPLPLPPIERVVDEGAIIARTAVRMHVKNHIIVDAIRHGRDYDADALAQVARDEYELLADQSDARARHQYTARNIELQHALADALRAAGRDEAHIAEMVEQSREEAWREVSGVVATTLAARAVDPARDPDYESEREARLRSLITVDLAVLNENARFEY